MRLLISAIVLFSASAMACPDLSGHYAACRSTTGQTAGVSDLVMTQSVENRITTYAYEATDDETQERTVSTIPADGKIYSQDVTEGDVTYQAYSSAHCMGNILYLTANASYQGQVFSTADVQITKVGTQLIQKSHSDVMGQETNETTICE